MIRFGNVPKTDQKGRNVEGRQRESPIFTPILPWGQQVTARQGVLSDTRTALVVVWRVASCQTLARREAPETLEAVKASFNLIAVLVPRRW
jgi:hypothetical protein